MVTKREVTYSPRPWGVRHRGKAGETTTSPASTPGGPHFALAHDNENRLAEAQQDQDPAIVALLRAVAMKVATGNWWRI